MKFYFPILLGILLSLVYISCNDDDDDNNNNVTYIECGTNDITNIQNRESESILNLADWPISIREYVACELITLSIREIRQFTINSNQFYLVEMSTRGYILFGADGQFICTDPSFNGGSRLMLMDIDTSGGTIDTTDNPMDTTTNMMDTLLNVIELDTCVNGQISFYRDVLPLIVSGCAYSGCHDAITHEKNVILETYSQIRSKVNPNNVNNSEIIKTFNANPNSDKYMPPRPAISFTSAQQQLIKDWISQGANETDCNQPCNSVTDISYSQDIYPLIANSCIGCHQTNNALDGVNLDNYDDIKFFANEGSLLGSIKHGADYKAMPQLAFKLTDCQIAKIENWITEGAQNN